MKFITTILLLLVTTISISQAQVRRGESVDALPGTVISFAGPVCPVGFLKNDGSAISRATYSKLFSAIGITYGSGNGSTTFNLPKYDWFIDVNIGGSNLNTNVSTGTYTEITNASLDMVINSSKGASPAEIPCSLSNPSTGLTCSSGSESLGISFIPQLLGRMKVCITFAAYQDSAGSLTSQATFQVVKTANNSQVILEEGLQKIMGFTHTANSGAGSGYSVCGIFNISDVSKQTFRLMNESNAPTPLVILGDRDAGSGQRDIHISVFPVNEIGNCIKY